MTLYANIILKPVDSRGARGVSFLDKTDNDDVLLAALTRAIEASPSKRIMAESYLAGEQYSTEGFLIDGAFHPIIIVRRNYDRLKDVAPFMIEDGGDYPPDLSNAIQVEIGRLALKAGAALGANTAVVKGDMVLTKEGAKVIEIALRPSGGYLCSDQIPLATGIDFIATTILLALGEQPNPDDLIPKTHQAYALRYFFPLLDQKKEIEHINDGTLISGGMINATHYLADPELYFLKDFINHGTAFMDLHDHTQRAGCVLAVGKTRQAAIQKAEHITNSIKYKFIKRTY